MADRSAERGAPDAVRGAARSVFGRTLDIIGAFAAAPEAGLTLSELAEATGLPMTTVHRLCGQLQDERVLERTPDRRYRVGLRLWELGLLAPRSQGLRQVALPFLEDLHEVVRQHVQLMVLDGRDAVVVERLSARDAVRLAGRAGGRLPAHATSAGVVLLGHGGSEALQAVLAAERARFTDATMTGEDELRAAVTAARRRGWAVLRGHLTPGSVSIAAPVTDRRGRVVAAVSVVAPIDAGERAVPAVVTTARAVGRALAGG